MYGFGRKWQGWAVKVTLGNADAENQEILSGLKKDAQVIVNPNEKLEDGKEIGKYDKID